MRKKRVVIASELRVFPVISGGNLRTKFIASSFAKRGYDVTIVSLADKRLLEGTSPSPPSPIREVVVSSRLFTLMTRVGYRLGLPPIWINLKLVLLRRVLHKHFLANADIIVSDFPYPYRLFKDFNGTKILNTHNVEHHRYPKAFGVRRWVRFIEKKAHAAAEMTFCCTPEDAEFFMQQGRRSEVLLVPNGIDATPYAKAREERNEVRTRFGFQPEDVVVLFPASGYGPNAEGAEFLVSFVKRHLDRLKALNVKVAIVGSVLPPKKHNSVLQTFGRVPKIMEFFSMADIAVNPIFWGSGSSLKVSEFIAAGLPLLTTKVGARGFDLDDQAASFFSDDATLMVALESILARRNQWESMTAQAWTRNAAFILGDKAFDEMEAKLKLN